MSVMSDATIREYVKEYGMIQEFAEKTRNPGCLSYGLCEAGYDIRFQEDHHVPRPPRDAIIDPKDPNWQTLGMNLKPANTSVRLLIKPNSSVLVTSIERFRMPLNVMAVSAGKSTYSRNGVYAMISAIDPGYGLDLEEGRPISFAIVNTTNLPAAVYANEGIAQLVFHLLDKPVEKGYNGAYQQGSGVSGSRVI